VGTYVKRESKTRIQVPRIRTWENWTWRWMLQKRYEVPEMEVECSKNIWSCSRRLEPSPSPSFQITSPNVWHRIGIHVLKCAANFTFYAPNFPPGMSHEILWRGFWYNFLGSIFTEVWRHLFQLLPFQDTRWEIHQRTCSFLFSILNLRESFMFDVCWIALQLIPVVLDIVSRYRLMVIRT